eukprot:948340-Prymnesium_polylepis.1
MEHARTQSGVPASSHTTALRHWRWQSGCVVGDRRDLLKLAVSGEDGGDGGGCETDCLSERSED